MILLVAANFACLILLSGRALLVRPLDVAQRHTLIIYVIANLDHVIESNFRYFVQHGMLETPEYKYIVVEQVSTELDPLAPDILDSLPANAKVIKHKNECHDLGTVGWLLFESGQVDLTEFEYYGWLNPTVMGPFVPSYVDSRTWPSIFTAQLSDDVKLSGTVLSCSGTVHPVKGLKEVPHLHSFLQFTDRVGLSVLRARATLSCKATREDVIYFGELGISEAITDAGYNMRSLMLRYTDVDWRKVRSCNQGQSSLKPGGYEGDDLDPLEVIFVKVKQQQKWWPVQKRARLYAELAHGHYKLDPQASTFVQSTQHKKHLRLLKPYFDFDFYREQHIDLRNFSTRDLFRHFLSDGYAEKRLFKLVRGKESRVFGGDRDDPAEALNFAGFVKNVNSPLVP